MISPSWSLLTPTGQLQLDGGVATLRLRRPWSELRQVGEATEVIAPTLRSPGLRGIAALHHHEAGAFAWRTGPVAPLVAFGSAVPPAGILAYAARAARTLHTAARAGAPLGIPAHGHLLPYVFLCDAEGMPQLIAWGVPEPERLRRRLTGSDTWLRSEIADQLPPEAAHGTNPSEAEDVWSLARALCGWLPPGASPACLRAALALDPGARPTLQQLAGALEALGDVQAIQRAAAEACRNAHAPPPAASPHDPAPQPLNAPGSVGRGSSQKDRGSARPGTSGDEAAALLSELSRRITPLGGTDSDPLA